MELMTSSGASESVIVTPGPDRGVSPAASFIVSTLRWKRLTFVPLTEDARSATSALRSLTWPSRASYWSDSVCTSAARSV